MRNAAHFDIKRRKVLTDSENMRATMFASRLVLWLSLCYRKYVPWLWIVLHSYCSWWGRTRALLNLLVLWIIISQMIQNKTYTHRKAKSGWSGQILLTCIVPLYWNLPGVNESGRPGPHISELVSQMFYYELLLIKWYRTRLIHIQKQNLADPARYY